MQYAFVEGIKSEPQKGLRGICMGCGDEMVAKCGEQKLHHWAHKALIRCDSWWEPETQWHRDWKNLFPESAREISFFDETNEEYHRADVHMPTGLTLEFQNSSLSIEEMQSREAFYPKMIWIVNGLKFRGFNLGISIPNPALPGFKDFEFNGQAHVTWTRVSERLYPAKLKDRLSLRHPEMAKIKPSSRHYSFSWKHAHRAWYLAQKPVFLDLGGHFLYWLKRRPQLSGDFMYLQMISKKDFLDKYS